MEDNRNKNISPSENEIKKIFKQNIPISDTVNNRIHDTYVMIKRKESSEKTAKHSRKYSIAAAAAALIILLAIPAATYASANPEFFEGMFGNKTKSSTPAVTKEIDNGKGGTTTVTIPSKEYVAADLESAEELIGEWVSTTPIEKQLGSHTLCINGFAYDKNSALIYFTLEREGGVTALYGNDETNQVKGAYFTEAAEAVFSFKAPGDIWSMGFIYVDTEKSTPEKMYCYDYILWSESLPDGALPQLIITTYPGMNNLGEYQEYQTNVDPNYCKVNEETIPLTDKDPIPLKNIDMGENGCLEYSPISISVNMANGYGLSEDEASDPLYLTHLEIKYKDGSSYIILDNGQNIENSSYACGIGTWYKTTYNRLVNTNEIQEIIVNDKTFPAE